MLKTPQRRSIIFIVIFVYFYLFLLFLLLTLNKTQLNVCGVSPYQLINAGITNCCNYLQMYKNLSAIVRELIRDCDPKQTSCSKKKPFFPCRELYLIAGNPFFQSTVFLYCTKVVAANHSLMERVFFSRALPTINCKYTMHLTNVSI